MKKVIITGASGLVGSYLLPEILKKGYEIFVLGRSNSGLPESVTSISIDLSSDWDESLLPDKADVIIHLAQSENFRDFPSKAKDVFYVNTLSTLKLADYAQRAGVSSFIYASSAGIYGTGIESGFSEAMEIVYKPELGFYLGTKHCSEVILDNYTKQFNVVMLRFFFVYGRNQREDMLIPRLVNFVKNGSPISLQGKDGLFINPTHASDAVQAILKALKLETSQKLNVAGPEVISLRKIVEIVGALVDKKPQLTIQESEPNYLTGDISKMSEILHSPVVTFENGVKDLL
ncbi:MAG: NAD(P)-dependent oxidoreductase [Bacteroidota bacterium]